MNGKENKSCNDIKKYVIINFTNITMHVISIIITYMTFIWKCNALKLILIGLEHIFHLGLDRICFGY